jgi:tetratricopeptide (TPR) repeat protein
MKIRKSSKKFKLRKMKKYILIIAGVVIASTIYAQKSKVVSAYNYNKAFTRSGKCKELASGIEAINFAVENDQTKSWAKTWYYRGNLYYNIIASKDVACKAIDINALDKCTDSYLKTLALNFDDSELKKLDLKKEDGSDLLKFIAAMQNNPKLDDEMYSADIMGRKFPGLSGEYANQGIERFGNKDYKGAQESFGRSMLLGQMGGKLDTMVLYNTALASEYAGDMDAAKQTYDVLIGMKYNIEGAGPGLYQSMSKIYKKEDSSVKAAEYISQGRIAYPDDNNLIVAELEGFLQSGNHDEALENLNIAIENDPKNTVLYFARGTVYESLKQNDNAITNYKKALELDSNYYDAAFNLGAYYFNKGADKINESNGLPLSASKKFDALKAEAKANFAAAVPYVEKAHELKPGDAGTGEMLIKLYTHTGDYAKSKEVRAKFE